MPADAMESGTLLTGSNAWAMMQLAMLRRADFSHLTVCFQVAVCSSSMVTAHCSDHPVMSQCKGLD